MCAVALCVMVAMMLFIFFTVVNRQFFRPVIGDIELVQLGMVVLIMLGKEAGMAVASGSSLANTATIGGGSHLVWCDYRFDYGDGHAHAARGDELFCIGGRGK